jgi:ribosomal protein L30E
MNVASKIVESIKKGKPNCVSEMEDSLKLLEEATNKTIILAQKSPEKLKGVSYGKSR